jgi:hypothetical protein
MSALMKAVLLGLAATQHLAALASFRRLARLERHGDTDLRGDLLATYSDCRPEPMRERMRLLCTELRRMAGCDGKRLTARHVAILTRIVASEDDDHELRIAALATLRYVADEHGARQVAAIANAPVRSRNDKALRRNARLYLPEIRARLRKERDTGRLLRPADPPPGTTLLRPAESAPKSDAALLVRPVEDEPGRDRATQDGARM